MNARAGARLREFLASGGWLLAVAGALVLAVLVVQLRPILREHGHAVGDGRHVASYGFTLVPSLVPVDRIVASGMPKDGLPALTGPRSLTLAAADAADRSRSARFLVPDDPVAGVALGTESRAYPLRLLVWHEVVNDTLAGEPIVVTYNPLCGGVAVFRRRVEGKTLEFGVSGLLFNSNLLMYDRCTDRRRESLWSQLLMRAVSGPAAAAGTRLEPLPFDVVAWRSWRDEHTATTVLAPDPRLTDEYRRDPYANYFGSDELRFPVEPLPPDRGLARKTPVVVALADGRPVAFPFPVVAARAAASESLDCVVGGMPLLLRYRDDPPSVTVRTVAAGAPPVVYAFRFAWYAMHPGDTLWVDRDADWPEGQAVGPALTPPGRGR